MSDPESPQKKLAIAFREAAAQPVPLEDGQTLYHQGESIREVYLLESGYIALLQIEASGDQRITALRSSPELLGLNLLQQRQSSETAVAKGQTRLLVLSAAGFQRLLTDRPELNWPVIELTARRQNEAEQRLRLLLTTNSRGRLARALCDLAGQHGGRCSHGHEVDVPLTQEELAQFVGSSRPVVSSGLNELRRLGLVDYARGYICVNDLDALRALIL